MTRYFPTYKAEEYNEINRKLTKEEYEKVEEYIENISIENGYMQDFQNKTKKSTYKNGNISFLTII